MVAIRGCDQIRSEMERQNPNLIARERSKVSFILRVRNGLETMMADASHEILHLVDIRLRESEMCRSIIIAGLFLSKSI